MVKIEFQEIKKITEHTFMRNMKITDINGTVYERCIIGRSSNELEIIDHENMPTEEKDFSFLDVD